MGVFKGINSLSRSEYETVTKNCMKKIDPKKHKEIDQMINQLLKLKKGEKDQ